MPLTILTATEARAAGCGETDTVTFGLAVANVASGKAAFFSALTYHQATLSSAAFIANHDGLDEACLYIAESMIRRRMDGVEWIGKFLDKLHPGNEAARAELIEARSIWCATFELEAA